MEKSKKDPNSFYKSKEWHRIRNKTLIRDNFRCVWCDNDVRLRGRSRVDHIKPLKTHPELSLDLTNLRTLCSSCDNKRHREKGFNHLKTQIDSNGFPEGEWGCNKTGGDSQKKN